MNGIVLAAANVAARYGVMGAEIPLSPTPEMVQSLADMTVVVTDGSGAKLAEGKGNAVLGSPLNVAIWIARDLAANGTRLKKGDLISVGSFSPLTPPKPGQTVTVRYEGLPGNPEVSVSFK
jgi:2-keto-4-pentenoate hydratase